jgi:hypothetical protein
MSFANGKFFTSADLVPLDPNPFCASLPFQLLFWNNSSWQEAAHCPRLFWYSTVRGLRRNGREVHLDFGSLVHEGADVYSKAVAAGADTELATEFALDHVLKASWPEGQERDVFGGFYAEVFQCSDRTRTNSKKGITRCPWSKAEHLFDLEHVSIDGTGVWMCKHCLQPVEHRIAYLCTEKIKNRRTLARTIVALCDRMDAGSIKPRVLPDGRIGSEYRWFQPLAIQSPDLQYPDTVCQDYGMQTKRRPYLMTGSFDGVAEAPGTRTVIPEYKSTQREPDPWSFWVGYEMSPQVHTYTWAGQKEFGPGTRVMLFAIHVGVGFTEIYPKTVYLSPAALQEWEGELAHKIQEFELRARLASDLEKRGEDPAAAYPRNLAGCNSLPGASTTPCPFRDFCRLDPADREAFLASNFEVAHYNPLGVKATELVVEEVE